MMTRAWLAAGALLCLWACVTHGPSRDPTWAHLRGCQTEGLPCCSTMGRTPLLRLRRRVSATRTLVHFLRSFLQEAASPIPTAKCTAMASQRANLTSAMQCGPMSLDPRPFPASGEALPTPVVFRPYTRTGRVSVGTSLRASFRRSRLKSAHSNSMGFSSGLYVGR